MAPVCCDKLVPSEVVCVAAQCHCTHHRRVIHVDNALLLLFEVLRFLLEVLRFLLEVLRFLLEVLRFLLEVLLVY